MADEKEYEGFIDTGVDTDDVHESQPVPTGAYDLEIMSAKAKYAEKPDGSGRFLKSVLCIIEIKDAKNASSIMHHINLWNKDEDKKKRDFKIVQAKKLYKLFDVPFPKTGINTTDLIGAKASGALVDLNPEKEKSDGSGAKYPPSNSINLNNVHV